MTPRPWSVERSRITYQDRWLKVVTDTCRAHDGRSLGDYHHLEYPDWVNVVALTPEGRVLLVREYRHARRSLVLGLPGGSLASSDEEPIAAAKRELLEETGYGAARWIDLGKSAVNAATHSNAVWSFLAIDARPESAPCWDANEELELSLVELGDLLLDLGRGCESQSLHLASLFLAVRFLLLDRSQELEHVRASVLRPLGLTSRGDEGA